MFNKVVFGSLMLVSFFLTGCNTFEGAGKDVKGAGEALTDSAHDSKEALSHRNRS